MPSGWRRRADRYARLYQHRTHGSRSGADESTPPRSLAWVRVRPPCFCVSQHQVGNATNLHTGEINRGSLQHSLSLDTNGSPTPQIYAQLHSGDSVSLLACVFFYFCFESAQFLYLVVTRMLYIREHSLYSRYVPECNEVISRRTCTECNDIGIIIY